METLESKIKSRWSRLSTEDIEELHGDLNSLPEKIQKIYGKSMDEAKQEVEGFQKSLVRAGTISGSGSGGPTKSRETHT